jgi:hypothetical protein
MHINIIRDTHPGPKEKGKTGAVPVYVRNYRYAQHTYILTTTHKNPRKNEKGKNRKAKIER